jgi:hypothetical protein
LTLLAVRISFLHCYHFQHGPPLSAWNLMPWS